MSTTHLGMFGIGIGFMLSPLTAAVLTTTPPTRVGLGSSMINTSRQVGSTLGVAVLGAFVVQQFSGTIASQLVQRGVPRPISATIASKIAGAGAQASRIHLSGPLLLPQETLHGSFLISGTALLAVALLVAFLLQQKQHSTSTSGEIADSPVTTGTSAMQHIAAAV